MTKIKTWCERCEEHPDHQSGIVTHQMIQDRMQEEIDELRAQPKYKRVDLSLKREMRNPVKQGGKSNDWYQNGYDVGYNAAIDDIKSKYGDLYILTTEEGE